MGDTESPPSDAAWNIAARARAVGELAGSALGEVDIGGRLVIVAVMDKTGGRFVMSTRTGHTNDLVKDVRGHLDRTGPTPEPGSENGS